MKNQVSIVKSVKSRKILLSFFVGGLLTACGSADTPDNAVNWVPLLLAIVLILLLGGALVYLIQSGKFKTWCVAGINAGKWKFQQSRLQRQKKTIKEEREDLMGELGKKAWEAKVHHPSYNETYLELVAFGNQITTRKEESAALENELKQVIDSRENVAAEYSQQIDDLKSSQKDVSKKLDRSKSEHAKLQKEFGQVNKQLDKTHAQIEENEGQLTEILASELPDKDSKAAALSNEIIAIRASLADDAGRIPDLENEISKLEVEQQPFEDQISRLTEQILTVEKNQEEALVPLDQRIADLKEGIQSTKSEVDDLKEKMKPIIQSLGPLVESARPESEVLTELYLKIDAVRANLGALIQEHDIVTTRLETGDQDEARNFYIMAGGILILVILIVVLLIVALG